MKSDSRPPLGDVHSGLRSGFKRAAKILPILVLIALVIWIFRTAEPGAKALQVLEWVRGLGAWGPLLFTAAQATTVVLLLPMPLFALGGGFLFGVLGGTAFSMAGHLTGSLAAYLLGRYLLGGGAARWIASRPRLNGLERALRHSGWKFVLSSRLIPGFPVKLSNYLFGWLRIPLLGFFMGNLIGLLPYQILNAYTGSLLKDLSSFNSGDIPRGFEVWVAYGIGLFVALVALASIRKMAKGAMVEKSSP